jgi:hypothetical protein
MCVVGGISVGAELSPVAAALLEDEKAHDSASEGNTVRPSTRWLAINFCVRFLP